MIVFYELKIVFNTDCHTIREKIVRHHLSDYKMMNMKGILTQYIQISLNVYSILI